MRRIHTLLAAAVLCGPRLAAAQSTPATIPAPRPNIVFILADDLGIGDVGCYGQKQIQTPNIDALAKAGVRFTQAYAGSPVCAPSRCALLTGLHSGHGFIRGNAKVSLRPADTTVEELLQKAGYATACMGKWGLGEPDTTGTPARKGFDFFYGFIDQTHAHNSYPSFLYQNDVKVELKNVVPNPGPYGQGVASVKVQFVQDLFDSQIKTWLDARAIPADPAHPAKSPQPFFLYVPFTAPHANNEARTVEVPDLGPYADKDWPDNAKRYAALVTRLDNSVAMIAETLRADHLDQNTLIIFASDNGPHAEGGNDPAYFHSSGPLRGIKRELYEGGIREPFIAVWPGHIAPATTMDQILTFWDFLPTACELAGAPTPPGLDGISLAPVFMGRVQTQQHEFLYWEFHENGFEQAVRMGDWKAVRHSPTGALELYDLKGDPAEAHDVAGDHADVITKITAYLATARTDSAEFPIRQR